MSGNWTKALPKEDGVYFYKEESEVSVVEFDLSMNWIYHLGTDVPWGKDMSAQIDGEFWTEPVKFPPNK